MRKISVLLILLACLLCMGMTCTNQGTTTKTIAEMTPKERAVLFLSFYNQEYADYKVQIAMGNLTEAAKETLRTKKGILTRVYPFIQSYDLAVAEGRTPEATLMPMIIGLLNQIGAKIQ